MAGTKKKSNILQNEQASINVRIPPQAVDVEKSVLGAMLIDKDAVPKVIELLDVTSFYNPTHQNIFQAMVSLFDKNDPIDTLTVVEELRRNGKLNASEDPVYITQLTMDISSPANVEYHARIVLEKALMRSLISTSSEVMSRAYSETENVLGLLDDAESKIFQISERRLKKTFTPINIALHETFELLQEIHGKHSGVTGVPSGFPDIDNITGGFQKSDLIIIAGRPSQGKTALALSIARNAALHPERKTPVAFFSLEMSEQQLIIRLLAAEAKVNAHQLRTGRLPEDNWKNLSRNVGKLAEAKIFLDDTPALGILELRAKARRLKAEHGIGIVVVDYLQLIQGPRDAESREREISWISRSLKALAKELNIPVIALSQLNRAVEARKEKTPMLADLRESGAIEQDADVVMFVHRPEQHGILEIKDYDGSTISSEGMAQIIVGKQRNGPTGIALLTFLEEYAGFAKRAHVSYEALAPPTKVLEEEPPF